MRSSTHVSPAGQKLTSGGPFELLQPCLGVFDRPVQKCTVDQEAPAARHHLKPDLERCPSASKWQTAIHWAADAEHHADSSRQRHQLDRTHRVARQHRAGYLDVDSQRLGHRNSARLKGKLGRTVRQEAGSQEE